VSRCRFPPPFRTEEGPKPRTVRGFLTTWSRRDPDPGACCSAFLPLLLLLLPLLSSSSPSSPPPPPPWLNALTIQFGSVLLSKVTYGRERLGTNERARNRRTELPLVVIYWCFHLLVAVEGSVVTQQHISTKRVSNAKTLRSLKPPRPQVS